MSQSQHDLLPSRSDWDGEPGTSEVHLTSDVQSLNLDALDIRELEQRIEMSVATDPVTNGYACGADCDSNCTILDTCSSDCNGNCTSLELCGTDDGSCTVDGCITDSGACEYNETTTEPVYIEPCYQ